VFKSGGPKSVLLTAPPHRDPQRLVLIPAARIGGDGSALPRAWPAAQWTEWRTEAKSIESLAAYSWTFNFLVLGEGSESLEGMMASGDYFRVLGLQRLLGRPESC
jgi:putative ABC transport system permease protein